MTDTALATRRAGLARVKLVGRPLLMCRAASLARDLALLGAIHRGEATIAPTGSGAAFGRSFVASSALATSRARRAPTFVGDFALPLPIRAEAALLVVRSDRHSRSS